MASIVTPLEWQWRRWRMRVGEYKNYTGSRPAIFPTPIPPIWWVRLKAFQLRTNASLLSPQYTRQGALWVQSDSEDMARAKLAGLGWALFQMGGDDWTLLKGRARALDIPWGYWFQCLTVEDIDRLLALCRDEQAPLCGINIEQELRTTLTPKVIRERIDASGYRGQISIIVLGWIQNDVKVTDADLGRYAWILEIFPQDAAELWPPYEKVKDCMIHAKQLGVRYPFQLVGTYQISAAQCAKIAKISPTPPPLPGDAKTGWYDLVNYPTSVFTADAIDDRWELWI